MSDLISRQAAIQAVANQHCLRDIKAIAETYNKDIHSVTTDFEEMLLDIANEIESLPPVEPKRPEGEWIEYIDDMNGARYGKCTSCNKDTLNAVSYDLKGGRHIMDFCPKCGAFMKGGTNKE